MKSKVLIAALLACGAALGQQTILTTNGTVAVRPYDANHNEIGQRFIHSGQVYSNRLDGTNLVVTGRVTNVYYEVDVTNATK